MPDKQEKAWREGEAAPAILPPQPRYHREHYDTPYYITPREQVGLEAFAIIRDAMDGKKMVRMGRAILSKRERQSSSSR